MMRHIWTVLCAKTAIDKTTNNISLFEVLESLQIVTDVQLTLPAVVPVEITVVTLWGRRRTNELLQGQSRIRLMSPDNEELMSIQTAAVDLQTAPRHRSIATIKGLRIAGNGVHEFEVSGRLGDRDDWTVAVSVPLEVAFHVNPSSSRPQNS